MRKSLDTKHLSRDELQRSLDAGDREAGTTNRKTWWEGETMIVEWPDRVVTITPTRITVSPIDRIKEKALQARSVVPEALKAVEADLDAIIAQKAVIAQKRTEAVAPHQEAVSGIMGELDGLKSALDILSNGGSPLDESQSSAQGS